MPTIRSSADCPLALPPSRTPNTTKPPAVFAAAATVRRMLRFASPFPCPVGAVRRDQSGSRFVRAAGGLAARMSPITPAPTSAAESVRVAERVLVFRERHELDAGRAAPAPLLHRPGSPRSTAPP